MKIPKFKIGQPKFDTTILLAVVLVLINVISSNLFSRMDFTKQKIFSLIEVSKNVVGNLDDKLTVNAYFSDDLPGPYATTAKYTKDLLGEYKAASKGNFQFQFIDPKNEQELKTKAEANGIFPVQLQALKDDKFEVRNAYMGLSISYKGKSLVIPVVQSTRGLEYSITSKIMTLSSQDFDKISIMNQSGAFATLQQRISENYEIRETDLNTPIAESKILILNAITDTLSEVQLKNLDRFLMDRGRAIFLLNKYSADVNNGRATLAKTNIFAALEKYGIKIKNNLLKDAESSFISVLQQRGPFTFEVPVQYPYLVQIHRFGKENIIVKNIEEISTAFVSEIDYANLPSGLNFTPLMFTSPNSQAESGVNINVSYTSFINVDLKSILTDSSRTIAGLYEGKLTSAYEPSSSNSQASILLITDANLIMDNAGARIPTNIDLIQNAVDYLSGKSEIINLRSREVEYRPLKEVSNGLKRLVKWVNVLLPTLLLLLYGLYIYRRILQYRRMLRFKYE